MISGGHSVFAGFFALSGCGTGSLLPVGISPACTGLRSRATMAITIRYCPYRVDCLSYHLERGNIDIMHKGNAYTTGVRYEIG